MADPWAQFQDAGDEWDQFADAPTVAPVTVPYQRDPNGAVITNRGEDRLIMIQDAAQKASAQAEADRTFNAAPPAVEPLRQFARQATFGLSDAIPAGIFAATHQSPGNTFEDAFAQARAAQIGRTERLASPLNTVAGVAGGILAPVPAARLLGAGSLAARAGRGALTGAGVGTVAGAANAPSLDRMGGDALAGGAVGLFAGGALPVVAAGAGNAARAMGITGRMNATRVQEGVDQATDALAEAGIDVRQVSQASMGQIRDLIRRGRSPREAALGVVAQTDLPVPLPMTRGDRTGQPGQQLAENLMLRGARGSGAAQQMRGLRAEQQDALRGNTLAIADQVAGGQAPTRGAAGEAISGRLNSMYDTAKQGVDTAYDAARATGEGARLPREQMPILGARLQEAVADYDLTGVPRVATELNRIDRIAGSGSVTVRDLFEARARLTKLRASNDPVEGGAAAAAARALDNHIDEAVTDDLFTGDPNSVAAWRDAISKRREFGRMFEAGDLINALTERTPRGGEMQALRIDPGDATNYILGRSELGFVGRANLYRDLERLSNVLGPSSPEWNGIRAEMFQRFASQGEGAVEFGARQFSGVKFQKAWQDFQRKDPRLAARMFTEGERALIDRFATYAARVTSPVKGGDNSSNTAVTAARMLGNLSFLRGLPFIKSLSSELEVQANARAASRATSQEPSRAPRPPVNLTPLTARGVLAIPNLAGQSNGQ